MKPFSTVTLSDDNIKDCILSDVKFPFTNVLISAKSEVNKSTFRSFISAFVAYSSPTVALKAFKSVISALFIIAESISAISALRLFISAFFIQCLCEA